MVSMMMARNDGLVYGHAVMDGRKVRGVSLCLILGNGSWMVGLMPSVIGRYNITKWSLLGVVWKNEIVVEISSGSDGGYYGMSDLNEFGCKGAGGIKFVIEIRSDLPPCRVIPSLFWAICTVLNIGPLPCWTWWILYVGIVTLSLVARSFLGLAFAVG